MPVAHARALLARQSANDALNGAKGGWSKCMSHAACKWPVIIGIIIGGLVILSLLFCCLRCCCCGAECCCGCLACCNACCPSPRRRGRKVPQDDNYGYKPTSVNPNAQSFQPQTQYQSHAPPVYSSPAANTGPQYAQFDVSKNRGAYATARNPDSLPSMPTWDNSEDHKIETFEHDDAHDLEHHGSAGAGAAGLRPGMYDRQGSHSNSNSRYSPVGESESYLGSQHEYNQSATGFGGAATGGYRGAAPPPPAHHSPYGGTPTNRSPTRQQFASAAPPSSFAAYSPHNRGSMSGSSAAPSYPGQKTYQAGAAGQRSPTSYTNYSGSTKVEPSLAYPDNYRPQTELSEPDAHVEGYSGGVSPIEEQRSGMGRKPVNGSWRDV